MRPNPVALIALVALPAVAEPARIDISGDAVQGVSGIEVSADGLGFVAVSDAGWFLEGRLERAGEDAALVGGAVDRVLPILGQDGFPVRARAVGDWSDAEGLATTPNGDVLVSFERWMRVARYPGLDRPAEWIRDHPDFRAYADNRQMEAVAVDGAGTVYALPESELESGAGFAVYRLDPDGWTIARHIEASGGYLVVGADFGPDGGLYILERKLVFLTWFRSRIRKIDPAGNGSEILWESPLGTYGNLEGLALWQAPEGLRAVMVSDNNARPGTPTEIVELRLTD